MKKEGIKPMRDSTSERTTVTAVPLAFEPGAKWCYSTGLDWAGFLVERVTGSSLEDYFQENIFR